MAHSRHATAVPHVPEAQGGLAQLATAVHMHMHVCMCMHMCMCTCRTRTRLGRGTYHHAPYKRTTPSKPFDRGTPGDIVPSQVNGARVRQRGTGKRSKTNTDFEVDIQCGMVVYKAAIKGIP